MGIFSNLFKKRDTSDETKLNTGGFNVIKYEGDDSSIIQKHPVVDFNNSSLLIVHEGQEALFLYDGEFQDKFGPGQYVLETETIAGGEALNERFTNGVNKNHAEVYFVNMTTQMGIKWGTPDRISFREPTYGFLTSIGASGEFHIAVSDSVKMLRTMVGTMSGIDWGGDSSSFTLSLKQRFKSDIITQVKSNFARTLVENSLEMFTLDAQLDTFSKLLGEKISPIFEKYGVRVVAFNVNTISLPEDQPEFIRVKELANMGLTMAEEANKARFISSKVQTAQAEQNLRAVNATTEAMEREIKSRGEAAEISNVGMAQAEVMRAKGYSRKDEIDADVAKSFAAGLGQFGANSGGGSGGAGGSGIASDMMQMMMGMKVAGMMTDKMDSALGANQTAPQANTNNGSATDPNTWQCSCGTVNTGKFCPNCGKTKPEPAEKWTCSCGTTNEGKFCMNCGKAKPEAWTCACGTTNEGKFCKNCGKAKPEAWTCACGTTNEGKFCKNCGKAKPEAWTCACGTSNTGSFCQNCGKVKPEPSVSWTCTCGASNTGKFCQNCGKTKPEEE